MHTGFSHSHIFFLYQDTTLKLKAVPQTVDSTVSPAVSSPLILAPNPINETKLEEARKVLSNIETRPVRQAEKREQVQKPLEDFDRTDFSQIPYVFNALDSLHLNSPNFLTHIPQFQQKQVQSNVPVFIETIAEQEKTNAEIIIPVTREAQSGSWLLIVLLILFSALGWFRSNFSRYLGQVLNGTISYQVSQRLYRDQNILFLRISGLLNVFFIFTTAVFLYQLAGYFSYNPLNIGGFWIYLILSLIFGSLFLLRQLSIQAVGFLFDKHEAFNEYLHNTHLYNKSTALLLLPVILGVAYLEASLQPILIFTGITLSIVLFILKILRGSQIILKNDVLISYWILYLCTLEILPLFLIYRYLLSLVT